MTGTLVSDFSITLNQRRWACVLDPALALSDYGLPLAKQLGELMELWIVREFWHLLDNTEFYLQRSDWLLPTADSVASSEQALPPQVVRSLQEWERLRQNVEPAARHIHFLADVIGESFIPAGTDADLIWRWESLAQSLDSRLDTHYTKANTLTLAYRDLAALAAARPARILTYWSTAEQTQNRLPQICTTLAQWGIGCREIDATNPLAQLEREQLHTLLVHAGLSKFLWAGLQLVVLHLVVPMAATLNASQDWSDDYAFSEPTFPELETIDPTPANLWAEAQAFWYAL